MKRIIFLLLICINCIHDLHAQKIDSIAIKHSLFNRKQLYTPTSLIIAGLLVSGNSSESIKNEIAEERNEQLHTFHTRIDDYLQYSPIAIAYGLDALGVRSKTDIANRTVILLKGELIMTAVVRSLKAATKELRPDGSAFNSFPSGHTAQAFVAAAFLCEEYKQYKFVPFISYGLASSVALLRMANNKHYINDVLVGAGIGILSTKLAYWTHQYKWNKKAIKSKLSF